MLLCLVALVLAAPASADPAASLSSAEASAASAEEEIGELEVVLGPREAKLASISRKAHAADRAAAQAEARVEQLRSQREAEARVARKEIVSAEDRYDEEEDEHEEQVAGGLAGFLAALTVAALALAWDWFRASALVAGLVSRPRAQAIGLTIGIGIALLILGGALAGTGGVLHMMGIYIIFLGLILPTAALLARHSAEVQRGRSKALLKRDRLPGWVTNAVAGICAVLAVAGLGGAISADGAEALAVTPELRAQAAMAMSPEERQRLEALVETEAKLAAVAARLDAKEKQALQPLAVGRDKLRQARRQLSAAESDVGFYSQRLAALEEREIREAEEEERRTEEEAEEEAEVAEEEAAEECNPNYSGCLDPTASDYDCAGGSGDGPLYTGTVEVIGYDQYGLDEDGDGIGCD